MKPGSSPGFFLPVRNKLLVFVPSNRAPAMIVVFPDQATIAASPQPALDCRQQIRRNLCFFFGNASLFGGVTAPAVPCGTEFHQIRVSTCHDSSFPSLWAVSA